MTLEDKVQAQRLHVFRRAAELGNVSAACREAGISRARFYELRKRYERYGVDGLHPRRRKARPGRPPAVAAHPGPRLPLRIARALATLGIVLGALAPPPVRALAAVPAATLASLLRFRPSERYGLIVVDGALLAGALVAIGVLARGAD